MSIASGTAFPVRRTGVQPEPPEFAKRRSLLRFVRVSRLGGTRVGVTVGVPGGTARVISVVDAGVGAAFTRGAGAGYDLQGNSKPYLRKALLAISIRHMFKSPPGENVGLLAVGNEIDLPSGEDGFWNVAVRFNTATKEMIANPKKALALMAPLRFVEPTLFDAIYFVEGGALNNRTARLFKNIVLSRTGRPKRSLDITNLGVVKECGERLKTIFFIPILSANYEMTIGIVTVNGEMNVVIMFDHSVIGQDTVERFKQGFISNVVEAV